jgi:hypothetical protein
MRHILQKGTKMTHTPHRNETLPTRQSGLVVALRVLFGRNGSGASSALRSPALLCLLTALGALLFALPTSPALAKQSRLFAGTFGAATSTTANPYPLSNPGSIAADSSAGPSQGDVYVADVGNHRIEKFDSSGHLLLMFGKRVNKTAVEEAKPEAQQNVCLAAEVCQPGTAGSTPGAFQSNEALFIAVDGSTGPSAGDVYVGDAGSSLGADEVTKFDENGRLVSAWGSGGQLDGSTAPEGPFSQIGGIAVDPVGNLWVLTASHFARGFEFKQNASFLTNWTDENGSDEPSDDSGLAVDSEDNLYYKIAFNEVLLKISPKGSSFGLITPTQEDFTPYAFAIDSTSNDLFAVGGEFAAPNHVQRYAGSTCHPSGNRNPCTPTESFGFGRLGIGGILTGAAVDPSSSSDPLYVVNKGSADITTFSVETVPDVLTTPASAFTATTARLNGTVNPASVPLTECFFEWGEGTEPYEHTAACELPGAAEVGSGSNPVAAHADIAGLQAGHTYHFRIVAANANTAVPGEPSLGQDVSFGPPLLSSTSALGVSASAATLQAQINPNTVATTYHFEYDTVSYAEGEAPHGTSVPLPEASAGSGAVPVARSASIQGLAPATTYHFRVVAQNILGTVEGHDRAFTTQGVVASLLPDGRVWEMVSPPQKNGIPLQAISELGGVIQAAQEGNAITYFAKGVIVPDAASTTSPNPQQVISRRGADGWSTQDLAPATEEPTGSGLTNPSQYKLFSGDLSLAAVEPDSLTPQSPFTSERTPYLRQPDGEYLPLVVGCPAVGEPCSPAVEEHANVSSGTKFGGERGHFTGGFQGGVTFITATHDLSHIILEAHVGLTATPGDKGGLYEWSAGELQLLSQFPHGSAKICGGEGPACLPAAAGLGGNVGNSSLQMRSAVSSDGSRVVISNGGGLYLRDSGREETLQLDAAEAGCGSCKGGGGVFQIASVDGSKVFFTAPNKLTADSGATNSAPDLYMCEVAVVEGHLACALTDLTVDHNVGESADVLGDVLGASEDGSSLYFVADGALTAGEGAVHGDCIGGQKAVATSSCNLYSYDTETETTRLVAVLSGEDFGDWAGEEPQDLGDLTARVSPNGRYLAFMSQRNLTGYENRDAVTGKPDQEVYLYDSTSGKPICASCNPTGARPAGVEGLSYPGRLVDRPRLWEGKGFAASIPGWTKLLLTGALYQSRYLSNSGRLFFNAADALVPQDSNGVEDVYEYEPPQVGGCTIASLTFGAASGGCVSLISSGTSPEESAFLDASESGNDVFFLTASKLATTTDVDNALDIYDASVGGSSPRPTNQIECAGDACQQPATPPNDATPGSLTFNGAGNLVECSRDKVLKSGKCVAKKQAKNKHKRKSQKKSKRASANRGGAK